MMFSKSPTISLAVTLDAFFSCDCFRRLVNLNTFVRDKSNGNHQSEDLPG